MSSKSSVESGSSRRSMRGSSIVPPVHRVLFSVYRANGGRHQRRKSFDRKSLMSMNEEGRPSRRSLEEFDASYQVTPPWDIGRPQPAFIRLAESGAFTGRVLA